MRWGPHRRLSLRAMTRRSVRLASRPGLWWGRQERSSMGWPARYRPTHRLAVAGETWKRSATRRTGQPSSTTRRARRRCPSGVSGALAWVMKASGQRCECVNPHHAGGLHTTSAPFTTSQGSTASSGHSPPPMMTTSSPARPLRTATGYIVMRYIVSGLGVFGRLRWSRAHRPQAAALTSHR